MDAFSSRTICCICKKPKFNLRPLVTQSVYNFAKLKKLDKIKRKEQKICTTCRINLKKTTIREGKSDHFSDNNNNNCDVNFKMVQQQLCDEKDGETENESDAMSCDSDEALSQRDVIAELNHFLQFVNVPIIDKKKIAYSAYANLKLEEIVAKLKNVLKIPSDEPQRNVDCDLADYDEMIKQLKDAFNNTTERDRKIQILTALPKSWTILKIVTEFNTSIYMAKSQKIYKI